MSVLSSMCYCQVDCFAIAEEFADRLGDMASWHAVCKYGVLELAIPCRDTFRHVELCISSLVKFKTAGTKGGPAKLHPEVWCCLDAPPANLPQCPISAKHVKDAIAGIFHKTPTIIHPP